MKGIKAEPVFLLLAAAAKAGFVCASKLTDLLPEKATKICEAVPDTLAHGMPHNTEQAINQRINHWPSANA